MTEQQTVCGRDVHGRLKEFTFTERGPFVSPGSRLTQRLVVINSHLYLYKSVPPEVGGSYPQLYELLDREIRAGTRLGQVYWDAYPPELARLMAYNVDLDEPFVLLQAYAGQPVAAQTSRFDDAQRWRFQIGLLRALRLTSVAGVVHGAVTTDAVRWDAERQLAQLVDFEWAERVGDPRRRGNATPARSPEQVGGTGMVDPRDDVWGAGVLIRTITMGPSANGVDRSADPERLRLLLNPVFDHPVAERPHPGDLLRMLHDTSAQRPLRDPEEYLEAARGRFDQINAAKHSSPPDMPQRSGRRVRRWFALFVAVVLVVTGLVLAAFS